MLFIDRFTQDPGNPGVGTPSANTTAHSAQAATTANAVEGPSEHNAGDAAQEAADTTDTTDANLLEALSNAHPTTANLEQDVPVKAQTPAPSVSVEPVPTSPRSPTQAEADSVRGVPEIFVEHFPLGNPGMPLAVSTWAPFHSQCDWEITHWAKMCGPLSSAMEELLAIPEVINKLSLSFSLTKELNNIIDNMLPGRPAFQCRKLVIGGETLDFYHHNVLACIRSIYSDLELAQGLIVSPEQHYTDQGHADHIYSEMHMGDWWWAVQTTLKTHRPGATVIPVIISSDKTQLTLFCGKSAYPVYLTIGNIPKNICCKPSHHAQILLTYIPTTKLKGITNKAGHRCAIANLYHSCMQVILGPITAVGKTGITMMSGDGIWQWCHPIFALFVGDYPEQVLVTCTYNGRCLKCLVPPDQLGSSARFPLCDYNKVRDIYSLSNGDAHVFHLACHKADQKPVFCPFWEFLPLTNVFVLIMPDILHQLLQGVFKQLMAWLLVTFGPLVIDAHCRSIPPNHHITIFPKGISWLSHVTGKEHKNMSHILFGLVMDLPVPSRQVLPQQIIAVMHALLDFLYLAQFPSHSTATITCLDNALAHFHDNKDVFVDLGVCKHFNMLTIHSLIHYSSSICLFGTTDNYNTEQTEQLHIDLTKDSYCTTNHKDEYSQMTTWLECCEKIQVHYTFLQWQQETNQAIPPEMPIGAPCPGGRCLKMAQHPTLKSVSFDDLAQRYSTVDFQDSLADFIAQLNNPTASGTLLFTFAADTLIPFHSVPVYHKIKFTNLDQSEIVNSVQVRPDQKDKQGLLVCGTTQDGGTSGYQIAQVRVVFQIPSKVIHNIFPGSDTTPPQHLTYVEWFSSIPTNPGSNHLLYKVTRLTHRGRRCASIIPVDAILCSVHLLPIFGQPTPQEWNMFSVLELCNAFYINPFSDRESYMIFQ
ncbi:hypothetical protein V8E53_008028 [Lactarius tabidus]